MSRLSVGGQQMTAKKLFLRDSYSDFQQRNCNGLRNDGSHQLCRRMPLKAINYKITFGLHRYIYEKTNTNALYHVTLLQAIQEKCPPPIYSTFTRSRSLILSSPPNSPTISLHPISPAQQIPKANMKFAMAPISDIELPYWRGTSGVQVSIATVA
jgi:hypothetical protein